jgi:hypothetical protein
MRRCTGKVLRTVLGSLVGGAMVTVGMGQTAIAAELALDSSTPMRNVALTEGAIKVVINYTPTRVGNEDGPQENNLSYQIFDQGVLVQSGRETTYAVGRIKLADVDANGTAEMILQTFTGGAHCCTNTQISSRRPGSTTRWQTVELGMRDGMGGAFQDLDGNGQLEFVTYDNSFLYLFSSYAGSYAPSQVFSFRNGQMVDTTRRYPNLLRSVVKDMEMAIAERRRDRDGEMNGILAGYVAQKALLGEFDQGWAVLLTEYDRRSDWGLDIYDRSGTVVGKYANFPAALRVHLQRRGYIQK